MKRLLILTFAATLAFVNSSIAQPAEFQSLQATDAKTDELQGNVLLYPNPVQDQLNVVSKTNVIERIDIYSFKGEILFTNSMEVPENARLTINMSSYVKGVYVVKIKLKNVAQPQIFRIYKG